MPVPATRGAILVPYTQFLKTDQLDSACLKHCTRIQTSDHRQGQRGPLGLSLLEPLVQVTTALNWNFNSPGKVLRLWAREGPQRQT